jgi:hypothetical protein
VRTQELVRLLMSEGVDPNMAIEATGWHALLAAVEGGGGKQAEVLGNMDAAVRGPYATALGCCSTQLGERESGAGGLTREVETPLPSNSPHGHMIY